MDVGKKKFDGTFESDVNPTRTSTNSWCSEGCYDDPEVQKLTQRIEDLTGIPSNNSEYWQLLRYEETQQYVRALRSGLSLISFVSHVAHALLSSCCTAHCVSTRYRM
jgi:hypothetical protein